MLQPYYYLVLEGFAFVICLLIYLNLRVKKSPMSDEKVFLYLILVNMVILCADILTWYTDGNTSPPARFLLVASNVLYYLLSSLVLFLWLQYVSLRIHKNNTDYWRGFAVLQLLPILFEAVMSITAPFNGLYFYVDAQNVYHRGPWCWTQAVIGIAYMLYAAALASIHCMRAEHAQERQESLMLVVFTIFPLLCSLVQSQFFGLPLIWLGTTISFMIFFIQTQNSQISLDALCQLNNRRKFDAYLWQKMHELKNDETLFLVVIDIDQFKTINDSYGHIEGDCALVDLANLLKKACRAGKDFAARYGGDEFALICVRSGKRSDLPLMEKLQQLLAGYNSQNGKPYTLSISYGIATYRKDFATSEDALKQQADEQMYAMKAIHHKLCASAQVGEETAE